MTGWRPDLAQRAVTPLAVVVDFDVFKYGFTYLGAGAETLTVNALDLQAVEEALRTGIVVTVALGAHAASQVMGSSQFLIDQQTVLIRFASPASQAGLVSAAAGCWQTRVYDAEHLRQYCDRYRMQPVILLRTMTRKPKPGLPRLFDRPKYRHAIPSSGCSPG